MITVGLFIHHLDNDYSRALLNGASAAAEELGVNLAIFPGRSLNSQLDDEKNTAFEYQNNVIYSFASCKSLDALILSAGTLGSFITKEEFKVFADSYEGLPIVTTENKVRGYLNVRMTGEGIRDIIRHLVTVHGKKHIAFVSGPAGNADADERLACYRNALEENGLPFDPDMVAYGKFSEYCVDLVGDLIDRNLGKIDAICFANDMMCKGGYKAIRKRGLRVGEDIAVTGYDDSEVAVSLRPMLTTVRADASLLGERALREAVRLAMGDRPGEDILLGSAPVFRQSCGCTIRHGGHDSVIDTSNAQVAADRILGEYIPRYSHLLLHSEKARKLREFIVWLFETALGSRPVSNDGPEGASSVGSVFTEIIDGQLSDLLSPENMVGMVKRIRAAAMIYCGGNPKTLAFVNNVAATCMEIAAGRVVSLYYSKLEELTFTHFLISNIAKDMTLCGSDESRRFFSIVNNLYRIHIISSYIYTYESPCIHTAKTEWFLPKTVMLQAYHDKDKLASVTGESRIMPSWQILNNRFTPADRRRTMVVAPLFMNEEQYGVMVCEMENEYFPFIYSITPQICTGIKLIGLVAQLEVSLDAAQSRNTLLDRISMCDELTGIFNRRGFYAGANHILRSPDNEGKRAVLLFADLDNLKKINDTFGHDDGDYAIISAANSLKSGLRADDVVARIGGDEFAAFALCSDKDIIAHLPERIKHIAAVCNAKSDKPYNVTVSIGLCEIICSPDLNIQQFMDKADAALYADKKNKSTSIFKAG